MRLVTLRSFHIPRLSWLLNRWRLRRFVDREAAAGRADIAEKTLTVLRDPAAAAARAAKALTVARTRFSVEECVNRSVAFYERVLAQHPHRGG